jgi:hypothetical protein
MFNPEMMRAAQEAYQKMSPEQVGRRESLLDTIIRPLRNERTISPLTFFFAAARPDAGRCLKDVTRTDAGGHEHGQ